MFEHKTVQHEVPGKIQGRAVVNLGFNENDELLTIRATISFLRRTVLHEVEIKRVYLCRMCAYSRVVRYSESPGESRKRCTDGHGRCSTPVRSCIVVTYFHITNVVVK